MCEHQYNIRNEVFPGKTVNVVKTLPLLRKGFFAVCSAFVCCGSLA